MLTPVFTFQGGLAYNFRIPVCTSGSLKHLSRDDVSLEASHGDFKRKLGPAQPKGSAFNPVDFNGRVKRKSLQINYAPRPAGW